MKKKEKGVLKKFSWEILCFIIAFTVPCVIMMYAFMKEGIHPFDIKKTGELFTFGDKQMLVIDLWHQYYPFFRQVREKLIEGSSFLFSWQNGLGTNFLALIAYYAMSPLNWLSVFFDSEHTRDALTIILVMKIGFSAGFFNCFLRYKHGRRDFSSVPFSWMYALCSYTLGYYWNVMWFDGFALFPLVMTGLTALCRERKWKLYTISLALVLISNYYIGYFICIFSVFMFLGSVISEAKGIKDSFYKIWLMIRSSLLGGCLGAFILIPSYLALRLTDSAENSFPEKTEWYEKWYDIAGNMISYNEPTHLEGLPNFACGILAVMLFGVFLFSLGIKIREKISMTLMLALIAVSCNLNKLNFIWHGFHFTNQLPYRFSFIFCFVLVACAYGAYDIIITRGVKIYQIPMFLIAPVFVGYCVVRSQGEDFEFSGAVKSSCFIAGAYFLIFMAVKIFPFKNIKFRNIFMNLMLAVCIVAELTGNAVKGVGAVGSSDYSGYPSKYEQVRGLLDYIEESDKSPFYRTEMTSTYTLNDSALYGYTGLSQFSSSANVSVTRLCTRLGLYGSQAGNRYYYRISTPVVNSLFGIKYLVSKYGKLNTGEFDLENIKEEDGVQLYENKYPLSLGFMMDSDILDMEDKEGKNPFEYQNEVIERATGVKNAVFGAKKVALVDYENIEVEKKSYGNYSFTVPDKNILSRAVYDFDGGEGEYLYGYASGGNCQDLVIKCNGSTVDDGVGIEKYPIVFPMGNGQENKTTSVEVKIKSEEDSGSYKLMVYALRESAFREAYERLADEQLEIDSFSDTKITGRVNAKNSGVLYLSVPYEKGWRVYVDGKKAETVPVLNAMLGVELDSGEHDIKLVYKPDGFTLGTIITFTAVALVILLSICDTVRRAKKKRAGGESEKSESDDGVQGDELPRISDTEERIDGSGDTGEESVESPE